MMGGAGSARKNKPLLEVFAGIQEELARVGYAVFKKITSLFLLNTTAHEQVVSQLRTLFSNQLAMTKTG